VQRGMTVETTSADGKNPRSFSEGITESSWRPGSVVDDARASIFAVKRLGGGVPVPLLVELTDAQVSAAARHAYDDARSVAAVALSSGPALPTGAGQRPMHRHTFCPQVFPSRQDAVAWLRGLPLVLTHRARAASITCRPVR
jgi:hypothetical protein